MGSTQFREAYMEGSDETFRKVVESMREKGTLGRTLKQSSRHPSRVLEAPITFMIRNYQRSRFNRVELFLNVDSDANTRDDWWFTSQSGIEAFALFGECDPRLLELMLTNDYVRASLETTWSRNAAIQLVNTWASRDEYRIDIMRCLRRLSQTQPEHFLLPNDEGTTLLDALQDQLGCGVRAPLNLAADVLYNDRLTATRRAEILNELRGQTDENTLHRAAAVGDLTGVELLLACGADPTLANRSGDLPLHVAVRHQGGDLSLSQYDGVVRRLVAANPATVTRVNDQGDTPLMVALSVDSPQATTALELMRATPPDLLTQVFRTANLEGDVPLHRTISDTEGNWTALLEHMVGQGADINAVNGRQQTIFHRMVAKGLRGGELRQFLLQYRDLLNGDVLDSEGRRPAEMNTTRKVQNLLRELVPLLLGAHAESVQAHVDGANHSADSAGAVKGRGKRHKNKKHDKRQPSSAPVSSDSD